jgi:hypothetical protein
MEPITIHVQLTVDQTFVAHLIFTNDTTEQLLLDKYTICLDGKFRNNVFEITDAKGKEVSYYGMMGKRVITKEDFIEFKPGDTVNVSVNLNDAYRLEPNKYSIRYFAYNPGLSDDAPFVEMISNTVSIHYK